MGKYYKYEITASLLCVFQARTHGAQIWTSEWQDEAVSSAFCVAVTQPRPVVFTRSFKLCKRGHYWLCNPPSISPRPCWFGFQFWFAREQRRPLLRQFGPHSYFSTLCSYSWQFVIVSAGNQMPSPLSPRMLFVDSPRLFCISPNPNPPYPPGHIFAMCLCVGGSPCVVLIVFL